MALAYANPAGSAVLLDNLYTAVLEGHAFLIAGSPSQMALHICPDVQYCNFHSGLYR